EPTFYLTNMKSFVGCGACGYVGEGEHFHAFRARSGSGGSAAGRQRRSSTYNGGHRVAYHQRSELFIPAGEERIGVDEERADPLLDQRGEVRLNVIRGDGFHDQQFLTERIRGGLDLSRVNLGV